MTDEFDLDIANEDFLSQQDFETDRLVIDRGQRIQCNVCAKTFDTSTKDCFVCFPPFAIDISSRCVACTDCCVRVTWRVDKDSGETMLVVTPLSQGTSTSFGPSLTENQYEALSQIVGRKPNLDTFESKAIQDDFDGLCEM